MTIYGVAKHLFSDMTGTVSKIVFERSLKMYGKPCRYGVAYGNHKSKVFRVSSDCRRVVSIAEGEVLQLWRLDLISWLLRCSDVPYPIDFRTVQVAPV